MNVLLFGGTGLLGRAVHEALLKHEAEVTAPTSRELDLLDVRALEWYFSDWSSAHRHGVIINCAAITNLEQCEEESENAWRLHQHVPAQLARFAQWGDYHLIQVSSDQVFGDSQSDPHKVYTDSDDPLLPDSMPVSVYGRTKAEGELSVLPHRDTTVVRVQWLHGPHRRSWIDHVITSLLHRQPIAAVTDYYGVPTLSTDVAAGLIAYLASQPLHQASTDSRIIHLVNSGAPVSRYDQAHFVADELGVNPNLVTPKLMSDMREWTAERPHRSFIAPTAGLELPDWRESLREYINHRRTLVTA